MVEDMSSLTQYDIPQLTDRINKIKSAIFILLCVFVTKFAIILEFIFNKGLTKWNYLLRFLTMVSLNGKTKETDYCLQNISPIISSARSILYLSRYLQILLQMKVTITNWWDFKQIPWKAYNQWCTLSKPGDSVTFISKAI